jgi:hypothetical protein
MNPPEQMHNHVRTIAVTVVALAAMLFAGYFLRRCANAPGEAVDKVPEAIDKTSEALSKAADRAADALKKLAGAINSKTIKTEYTSTGTTLAGTSYLQVARINQVEIFDKRDSATVFGIPLPDVVVSARAPVEYTYYLDLTGDWDFLIDGNRVYAIAPTIQYNKPSVDASAITYKVEEGSIIRDHKAVILVLKQSITAESLKRADQNIQIVREAARREAERFVQRFIMQAYGVEKGTPVSVVFRDEAPPNIDASKL